MVDEDLQAISEIEFGSESCMDVMLEVKQFRDIMRSAYHLRIKGQIAQQKVRAETTEKEPGSEANSWVDQLAPLGLQNLGIGETAA